MRFGILLRRPLLFGLIKLQLVGYRTFPGLKVGSRLKGRDALFELVFARLKLVCERLDLLLEAFESSLISLSQFLGELLRYIDLAL